jgi:SsrA-binding protein
MTGEKIIAKNRKAYHDYFVLEKYETGIALQGTEVKSIRQGKVTLKEGFARIMKNELFLFNVHISHYTHGNIFNHDPLRTRKLLMHRKEINKLIGKTAEKGLSLIPVSMYLKKGKVKIEIALCQGKRQHDKRETIKKRDLQREEARYNIKM